MAYLEPWNIQTLDGVYIPARHIVKSLEKKFYAITIFAGRSFLDRF